MWNTFDREEFIGERRGRGAKAWMTGGLNAGIDAYQLGSSHIQ